MYRAGVSYSVAAAEEKVADIETVVAEADSLGESPLWHPVEQVLYWLDIKAPAIRRYDPANGTRTDWAVPQEIGSIGLHRSGSFVAGLRDGFAIVSLLADGYSISKKGK